MTEEIWKVTLIEGLEASSWGRLRVTPFKVPMPNGGMGTRGGKPTYGYLSPRTGYHQIWFRKKSYTVSRLVCGAFHGAPPFSGAVCMHLDEDRKNNCPDNLAWGTRKENLNAPGYLEYCRSRTGIESARAKWKARRMASNVDR